MYILFLSFSFQSMEDGQPGANGQTEIHVTTTQRQHVLEAAPILHRPETEAIAPAFNQ